MIDAQPVERALGDQAEDEAMGLLEHLGILLAHPGQVVDVEEPAMRMSLRINIEKAAPQLRIGPEPVGLVGGHVVGNDVENQTHSRFVGGRGQPAQLGLAAEIRGHPGGIDHVIAVRGPGSGLQRWRQVQVRDAQVAQIGDQLPRGGEAEIRRELKPVGGAKWGLAHATRLRMVIECAVTLISAWAS